MYEEVLTGVQSHGGETNDYNRIALRLNPKTLLFYFNLDVLMEHIQELVLRCMLFENDIVLLGESKQDLNERLKTWRRVLETHGFWLSRSRTKSMECKFNKRRNIFNLEVIVGDHIIPQVTWFKYLAFVVQNDGEIKGNINN